MKNPFAIGLTSAPKKRSIIPTTTTAHTENTDRLPLLQTRTLCLEIASVHNIAVLEGTRANTPPFLMQPEGNYVLAFTFDAVVTHIIAWAQHDSNQYSRIRSTNPHALAGTMVLTGLRAACKVHFQFSFTVASAFATALGSDLQVNGEMSVFRML